MKKKKKITNEKTTKCEKIFGVFSVCKLYQIRARHNFGVVDDFFHTRLVADKIHLLSVK